MDIEELRAKAMASMPNKKKKRKQQALLHPLSSEAGSTRFCMGVAWRDTVGRKTNFNQILDYVKEIRGLGMEVRCTLGMLEKQQAEDLKKAGLTAYNHNLDTSREFYPSIITTRSYDERLKTLEFVREAGISVRSGKGLYTRGQDLDTMDPTLIDIMCSKEQVMRCIHFGLLCA